MSYKHCSPVYIHACCKSANLKVCKRYFKENNVNNNNCLQAFCFIQICQLFY